MKRSRLGGIGDANFKSVVLQSHFDTDFSDRSIRGQSLINNGSVTIGTINKKFGPGAATFNGSNSITVTSTDFAFGAGDFTMEGWVFDTGSFSSLQGYLETAAVTGTNGVGIYAITGGVITVRTNSTNFNTSGSITNNTWNHLAVSRNSGNTTAYINGTSVLSTADAGNYTNGALQIGTVAGGTSYSLFMAGSIDEVRITKGIGRYTSSFTVSSNPFMP